MSWEMGLGGEFAKPAPQDAVAEYVRQLLELEKKGQVEQASEVPSYVSLEDFRGVGLPGTGFPMSDLYPKAPSPAYIGFDARGLASGVAGGFASPDAKAPPKPPPKPVVNAAAAEQLQHATVALQEALSNWEACLQREEEKIRTQQQVQQILQQQQRQEQQRQEQLERERALWAEQQQTLTRQIQSALSAQSQTLSPSLALQKAIFELAEAMPPHLAADALSTLATTAAGGGDACGGTGGNVQVMRMLAELLEQQQDQSVCKLMKMLQTTPAQTVPPAGEWSHLSSTHAQQGRVPQFSGDAAPYSALWPTQPQIPPHMSQHFARGSQQERPATARPAWSPGHGAAQWKSNGLYGEQAVQQPPTLQPQMTAPPGIGMNRQQYRDTGGANYAGNMPATHRRNRVAAPPSAEEETLRSHLRDLQSVDSSRIVLVRKINRLGFDSPTLLEEHYKTYGTVERVLVAHSHVKSPYRRYVKRLRPSGLGFIVMASAADVKGILKDGFEQMVSGAMIKVQPFERRGDEFDSFMSEETGNDDEVSETQ